MEYSIFLEETMEIIKRIVNLMDSKGISAHKLEVSAGLSISSIQAWKNGKAKPSVEAIKKIAEYFNVSTDYLLLGVKTTLTEEEKQLVSLISQLTTDEVKELSNFVDYIISKRK